jgi:hypothetical protein
MNCKRIAANIFWCVTLLALLFQAAACSSGGGNAGNAGSTGNTGNTGNTAPSLVSIVVTPSSVSVALGATQQFAAIGNYSDNSSQDLTSSATWTSSNTAGALVSSTGLATSVGTGTALISAASGSVSGTAMLTVAAPLSQPAAQSPFGIYSPYGEFSIDEGTFATQDDITGYLQDIGVPWVQEFPIYAGFDAIPSTLSIYSRVGKEAGINSSNIADPNVVANYKTAVTQRVGQYKDKVKYWEVDTEPDGIGGWKNDPQGYVDLLKITYPVIKGVCADCMIMFGGLSGGNTALDNQGALFLESALSAGAVGYFDGLEFKRHHTSAKDYARIKNNFDSIGSILANYGVDIHQIPVFVETAMYDGDPNDPVPNPMESGLPIQTEKEQAQGLIKTYVYGAAIGIDRIFWDDIYERSDYEPSHATPFPQNPFNHYGLINNPTNNDGLTHKKLAYYTYKKMVEMLEGSDWNSIQTIQESGNIYIFKFTKNNALVYVAWWDYFDEPSYASGNTKPISIAGVQGNSVLVTEAVPKFSTGKDVTDYATAFNTQTVSASNGTITLTLNENPVFVEALQ